MKKTIQTNKKLAIKIALIAPVLFTVLVSFTNVVQKGNSLNTMSTKNGVFKANTIVEDNFGIYGGIYDYKTSKPVKGVKVELKETGAFAITDENGYFEIQSSAKNIKAKRTLVLTYNETTKTVWSPSSSYSTANIDNLFGEVRTYFIDTQVPGIVSRFSSMGELKTKESLDKKYINNELLQAIKRKDEAIQEYDKDNKL
jgi:hypothetical protein